MQFKSKAWLCLLVPLAIQSSPGFAFPSAVKADQAQRAQSAVRGQILNAQGLPVAGATVFNLSNKKSAVTDARGNFLIEAAIGDKLRVSHLSYRPQETTVSSTGNMIIDLESSDNTLEEVTVSIGYQRVRKSDVTGAIASVKADEMNLSAPKLSQALVGKIAGVQVSQTSGAPYQGTKIRVRGVGSINASSNPLYVIDGYPTGNNLNINLNDIESIEVLKDAASAAIYGSRAAGGVILITTKRGKLNSNNFEYDYQGGFGQLSKKIDLLNADQFIDLMIDGRNNAYKDLVVNGGKEWKDEYLRDNNATRIARVGNAGSVSIPDEYYDFSTGLAKKAKYDTDWQDVLYRNAQFQRHNLSFYGGNEKNRYFLSSAYQDQDGIMTNTGQKVFNFRLNADSKINNVLSVGANVSFTYNENKEVGTGRFNNSPSMAALLYLPTLPAFNDDGTPAQFLMAEMNANNYGVQNPENPLAFVNLVKDQRNGRKGIYNAYANLNILKGLNLKINGGLQLYNEKYDYFKPTSLSADSQPPYSAAAINAAYADARNYSELDKLLETTLNYNRSFNDVHNLDLLFGYSAQRTDYDMVSVRANGFQNDAIGEISDKGAAAANFQLREAYKRVTTLQSVFSRLNYNYKSKYYLSASFRTDGSSRFGPNKKWGTFPSASLGWNISNEDFYDNWLGAGSSVKLRASWGLSGNNNIGDYKAITTFGAPDGVVMGDKVVSAYSPNGLRDANLGWESTSQYNFGLDLNLFHGNLNIIGNYYLSRSFNLLFNQPVSAVSGTSTVLTNLKDSKVQNKGFDLQADATLLHTSKLSLNLSGNINVNRNKVLDMGGASTIITNGAERSYMTHITQQGSPIGMFYGFKVLGVANESNYKTLAPSAASTNPLKPGDLYFEDVDGNGVVNDNDKRIIGSPYPDFTYGFAVSAKYSAFDLRASFNGSEGNEILDGYDYYLYNMEGSGNQYVTVNNRWRSPQSPGNGVDYRASRAGTQSNSTRLSSFYLQDGSYLRMTNLTIGYTVPKALVNKIHVAALRVFGSVDNVFTLSDYKGYNPEADYADGANLTPGVDYGLYPLVRSFNLGLKITF